LKRGGSRPNNDELREYAARMSEAEQIVGFGVWRWELETGRVLWSDEWATTGAHGRWSVSART
jgi:hypothetical protein